LFESAVLNGTAEIYFSVKTRVLVGLPSISLDERKLLTELTGNTLVVYWYLLRKRGNPAGVREIQRALGFLVQAQQTITLKN